MAPAPACSWTVVDGPPDWQSMAGMLAILGQGVLNECLTCCEPLATEHVQLIAFEPTNWWEYPGETPLALEIGGEWRRIYIMAFCAKCLTSGRQATHLAKQRLREIATASKKAP